MGRWSIGAIIASASGSVLRSAVGWVRPVVGIRMFAAACLAAACLVATSGALLPAQTEWSMRVCGGRREHAMAYDSARGRLVLFGGYDGASILSDTWEWDGVTWSWRNPGVSPPARIGHALAYDSSRGRVVLFGGTHGVDYLSDTWEWDGSTWTQRTPVVSPPARADHALAYDSARGRVVLFGGLTFDGRYSYLSDTWEWDGNAWTQRKPAASPAVRHDHALAYDSARGKIVLFGGVTFDGSLATYLSDTWEWDGNAWTQRKPAVSPGARRAHALAYDSARGKVVLFGGYYTGVLTDMWEWDGDAWLLRMPSASPRARIDFAFAYDRRRGRMVLFGGMAFYGSALYLSDTWEWDGSAWTQGAPPPGPAARDGHALAYDSGRGRVVLFGGFGSARASLSDTWEWDGSVWTQRTTTAGPRARRWHALAYDGARGRVVLFGGSDGGYFSDTWEWDGDAWTQVAPGSGPPPRLGHALAYDSARGRVVLFGGYGSPYPYRFSDTWVWDGNAWAERTPAGSPPARGDHALAYDSARGRVVLFGGTDGMTRLSDTWEWDGNVWMPRLPAVSPPARSEHALAYDSARGRVVLFGGTDGMTRLSDTWEWDGSVWIQRTPAVGPRGRVFHAVAYDSARSRVVLFGGFAGGAGYAPDLWEYGPVHPASHSSFGNACSGSAGPPLLRADAGALPWLGEAFTLRLSLLPPSRLRVPFLLLGSLRTMAGPHSLPLDLGPFGMPGCALYVSGEFDFQLANMLGTATWTVVLPSSASLAGAGFFAQAFVLDPGVNPLGIVASNAVAGVIGSK